MQRVMVEGGGVIEQVVCRAGYKRSSVVVELEYW